MSSNRVIKFRVWDKPYNDWLADNTFAISDNGMVLTYRYGGIIGGWKIEDNQKNFIIQQFTGLTDRNNKEIYEGDILEIINDSRIKKLKVIFDYTCAAFCLIPINWNENEEYPTIEYLGQNTNLKIIGNIFENPGNNE